MRPALCLALALAPARNLALLDPILTLAPALNFAVARTLTLRFATADMPTFAFTGALSLGPGIGLCLLLALALDMSLTIGVAIGLRLRLLFRQLRRWCQTQCIICVIGFQRGACSRHESVCSGVRGHKACSSRHRLEKCFELCGGDPDAMTRARALFRDMYRLFASECSGNKYS